MNVPRSLVGLGLTFASLSVASACASSGQSASGGAASQTAPAQAGATAPRRGNSLVLTGAEIAGSPGLLNAYDAVQALRPHFLRTRGVVSSPGGASTPDDVGILVYLDRQRYGRLNTLREIPVATIEEIRFLNVGEANSQFGMGHPHGAIQIITKRGP
jgi:hypothetical protein